MVDHTFGEKGNQPTQCGGDRQAGVKLAAGK